MTNPCESCEVKNAPYCDRWDICEKYKEYCKGAVEAQEGIRRVRENEPELYEEAR